MITYSSSDLLSFNSSKFHLPLPTFKLICSLSLNRIRPTHRSNRLSSSLKSLFHPATTSTSQHSPLFVTSPPPPSPSFLTAGVSSPFLSAFLLNIRSLAKPNKYNHVYDTILTENPSFFALTESWLSTTNLSVSSLATPPNYSFLHNPRKSRRGGGVALICANHLHPNILSIKEFTSFESIAIKIKLPKPFIISVIYRPPSSSAPLFLDHFTDYLSLLANFDFPLLIIGDFNIHVNTVTDFSSHFLELLELFNLSQYSQSPTHISGNTLDLVISNIPIHSLSISNPFISDHYQIKFKCSIPHTSSSQSSTSISFRKLSQIDFPQFNSSLSQLLSTPTIPTSSPDALCNHIFSSLQSTLDSHAPSITRSVRNRPNKEWYTEELRQLKRARRACERRLHSDRLNNRDISTSLSHLKTITKSYFSLLTQTRYKYTQDIISSSGDSHKTLFKMVNKYIKSPNPNLSPPSSESFANFFLEKVTSIHSTITPTDSADIPPPCSPQNMSSFNPVTSDEVLLLIQKSKKTFSPSDPFPSKLLPNIIPTILPSLVALYNQSLHSGYVPIQLKHSFITPLIKNPDLDSTKLSNYRPISLLPLFSKILERLVATRLLDHMSNFLNYENFQSGFKAKHSSESALLYISDELRRSADSGNVSILVLLDLSAAFDTLNHTILIQRLQNFLGLSGTALDWFISYLSNRSFQVKQKSDISSHHHFVHGVPQGSVLGPILFRIYMLPLLVLLSSLGVSFHCYADDTQLYIPCTSSNFLSKIEFLQTVHHTIHDWLSTNFLKLNNSKTEVMLIGTPHSVAQCKILSNSITFNNSNFDWLPTVKNLGVIFDESLSFLPHIKNCRKTCFFLLRNLTHLRPYFNRASFEIIINSLITSRLDYCNSLFSGLPASSLSLLQSIQNYAARLICRRQRRTPITPILCELHWLPVSDRIKFKLLLTTYKLVHQSGPDYLLSQITFKPSRHLRNHDNLLLEVPRSKSARMGDRAFSTAAPQLWNSLPYRIRNSSSILTFKKSLKTHLFSSRYSSELSRAC